MDYSYFAGAQTQPFSMLYHHGLPTPDQPHARGDDLQDALPPLNAYHQNYNAFHSLHMDPAGFVAAPHSPPESYSKQSVSSIDMSNVPPHSSSADGADDPPADGNPPRSSSEEKEGLTPAQSKRKAQNRAAQRAFRERKERHVRELEQKVNDLEQESTSLAADNERLKRELAKFATENEILRATSSSLGGHPNGTRHSPEPTTTGPMQYTPTDFYSSLSSDGYANPLHRVTICPITGERLLGAGATWDFIQAHELFKRGLVNIGNVCERLKGSAQCDGQGPAFKESIIRKAIEESAAGNQDELI